MVKSHVNNKYQRNLLKDISWARAQQVAAGVPLMTFLRAMACGLCEFLLFCSQGKSPSAYLI